MPAPLAQLLAPQATIIVALIAATSSLLVAIISLAWNFAIQRRTLAWKNQSDLELAAAKSKIDEEVEARKERLRSELSEASVKGKARLDYEYEALKRLYTNVEPLIFQLVDQSEGSMHRIVSLARSARKKEIKPQGGWLGEDGYYLRSTTYRLLAPLATFRLIQRKLTIVDLSLDPWMSLQFKLCQQVYYSFTDDFQFARGGVTEEEKQQPRKLPYAPNAEEWRALRRKDPAIYWRQGLPIGVLDQVLDSLAIVDGDAIRILNFREFDERLNADQAFCATLELAFDVIRGFHPQSKPVLWRMLVNQYYLHKMIQRASEMRDGPDLLQGHLGDLFEDSDQRSLDWDVDSWNSESVNPPQEVVDPINVAKDYLRLRFSGIKQRNVRDALMASLPASETRTMPEF